MDYLLPIQFIVTGAVLGMFLSVLSRDEVFLFLGSILAATVFSVGVGVFLYIAGLVA